MQEMIVAVFYENKIRRILLDYVDGILAQEVENISAVIDSGTDTRLHTLAPF